MSAVEGNDDKESTAMSDADGDRLVADSTGAVGLPANCVAKEQERKHHGLKVRQPRLGFFSRRKLALGKRNVQDHRGHRKLRYQCLEQMVLSRERAIQSLRRQLETYKKMCVELDEGRIPNPLRLLVPDADAD